MTFVTSVKPAVKLLVVRFTYRLLDAPQALDDQRLGQNDRRDTAWAQPVPARNQDANSEDKPGCLTRICL